ASVYRALFMGSVIPLNDHRLSGDAIIEHIAGALPPGAEASLMGMQNIKGTGLDFVYRWLSIDLVSGILSELEHSSGAQRAALLNQLLLHDNYGALDAQLALDGLQSRKLSDPHAGALPYDAVIDRLQAELRDNGPHGDRVDSLAERARTFIGNTFDFVDSILRRISAARIMKRLVQGELANADAAKEMRALVARAKTHI
ncbi:MAG TPA: hypothetical protein VL137_01690, partial [Polyangiaceae bacterium]|nr:hypothetical protein [Polyangiaceae bacterium]